MASFLSFFGRKKDPRPSGSDAEVGTRTDPDASPETRAANLENPQQWLVNMSTGATTGSGKRVTTDNALTCSVVYAAVKVISDSIGALPIGIFTTDSNGNRTPATNNPLFQVLHTRPNPEQTAMEFYEAVSCDLLMHGNFFAVIERDGSGAPAELWRLIPQCVQIERLNGKLVYNYQTSTQGIKVFQRDSIVHVRNMSKDGVYGLSVIALHRESIGLSLAAQEYAAKMYANGAVPSGILSTENRLSPEGTKNLKTQWDATHKGSANSHRVSVLTDGLKFQPMAFSPVDAEMLAQRQFSVQEIARVFRVPAHMVGDLSRATFSNIENQSLEFVRDTIRPWVVRIEQAFERDLLNDAARVNTSFNFNLDALLRADIKTRFESYQTGFMNSIYSTNEIRQIEGMNSIGEEGEKHYRPIQLVPLDTPVQTPEEEPEPTEEEPEPTEEESGSPETNSIDDLGELREMRALLVARAPTSVRHALAVASRPVFVDVAHRILDVELPQVREI
ncbi:hypothetical protein LCGC14_1908510, partial [marine sediment metagenome]